MPIETFKTEYGFVGRFNAMASPCECLIESDNHQTARQVTQIAASEAWRIEKKYSRYLKNNLCFQINQSKGKAVPIDRETFCLLDFANTCFQISDELFDLTSGVLRRIWQFSPGAKPPNEESIAKILPMVGWQRVEYNEKSVILEPDMEIDFGGIGKEYAVDLATKKIQEFAPEVSVVVNFGGDLRVTHVPYLKPKWQIGIDSLMAGIERSVAIGVGAVCTSGDTERYLVYEGKRYSHILNPKTGWPVDCAPKTITVIADQCLQAGILATIAMLQGPQAEFFLEKQNVKFYCQR